MGDNGGKLDRVSFDFPDGEDGRAYYYPSELVPYSSVTTIIDRRHDPDKEDAINGWERKYSGEDGKGDSEHLKWWTGNRGTLIHYYVQSHLAELEKGWDEKSSLKTILEHTEDYDRIHSVIGGRRGKAMDFGWVCGSEYYRRLNSDEYDPMTLEKLLWKDMDWALRAFANLTPELGLAAESYEESDCVFLSNYYNTHIHEDAVKDVERYVLNKEQQYAGQFDLLLEINGKTVLADLKTSKNINRWGYRCQGVAYANALDVDIDEIWIIQLYPDKQESSISRSPEWDESRDELWEEFCQINEDHVLPLTNEIDLEAELEAKETPAA